MWMMRMKSIFYCVYIVQTHVHINSSNAWKCPCHSIYTKERKIHTPIKLNYLNTLKRAHSGHTIPTIVGRCHCHCGSGCGCCHFCFIFHVPIDTYVIACCLFRNGAISLRKWRNHRCTVFNVHGIECVIKIIQHLRQSNRDRQNEWATTTETIHSALNDLNENG